MTIDRIRIAFAVAGALVITPFAIMALMTAVRMINRF